MVEVATPVVVRFAGLPAEALRDLRFAGSFGLAGEIAVARRQLTAAAGVLSDDLFAAIGDCPPGTAKGALVGLRRAVFRLRAPGDREWNEQVAGLLPDEVAVRVGDWLAALDDYRRRQAELPERLAREGAAKQQVLRGIVGHPWFRHALAVASPALSGEAAKWLADGTDVPRRASLVRLAKYVARAAAKTSPYSTFMVSGWSGWSADGPGVRLAGGDTAAGVLELSGFLQARLRDALREAPGATGLPLRLNPSAVRVGATVRFLGPPPHESIVSVAATSRVLDCLRIAGDGASHPAAELGAALGGRLVGRLVEAGLLERVLPVADLAADPLGELSTWLTAAGAAELGAAVERVGDRLRHPGPVDRIDDQRELAAAVEDLGERAGLPIRRLAGHQVDLWHENAVHPEPVGELSAAAWQPALADLDVIRRLLAALDPALPLRVALGAFLRERFGSSPVPFLTLYETVERDLAARAQADEILDRLRPRPGVPGPLRESRLDRLRELARLQDGLREAALPPADPDGIVRADPEVLAKLAESWPDWLVPPASMAAYLQVIPGDDGLRLVVNAAHGGNGRGRSRALHLIRAAGGNPPYPGADSGAAEFGGLFGFAPNVRLATTPYEIDYPFVVSARPAGQRLPVRDLTVGPDPVTGLAALFGPGDRPVSAEHLGMMANFLLPRAARFLTQAFGCGYLIHAHAPLFAESPPQAGEPEVRRSARVEIGRVVVRRQRWVAPTELVPVRNRGEDDAAYLVRIVDWLVAYGIPSRCFVRMNEAGGPRFDKSRKPVYVDFANWYLVQAFERMLTSAGRYVVFDEALPPPEDAPLPMTGPAAVAEFLVEISGGRRG